MSDYRSNKTNAEIDAILDNAAPVGGVEDGAEVLSLEGTRRYAEILSRASLICAGEIIAPHTILGSITIGAEVEVTDAFRLKFRENNPAVTKVVLVDKRVVVGEGDNMDTRYIYSGDYEGCYFVMGNFDGNDTIFGLDAIEGDWVIAQNKRWAKVVTKQREISDLDAIRRGAGKGDTSVQGVFVNNRLLTPDTKGNISLPAIPTKDDISDMGFTPNKGTVTGVMVNGESKSPNSDGIVDLGEIKVDEAKFANDLTGVIEATPEMFTYRPSAGDKSVRDESAVIRRIKGNTSVWSQQAVSLAEIAAYRPFFDFDGDKTFTLNQDLIGQNTALNFAAGKTRPIIGHTYLLRLGDFSLSTGKIYFGSQDYNTYVENGVTITKCVKNGYFYLFPFDAKANTVPAGTSFTLSSVEIFDLTDIFGAGNEPTTYEEFRKYYPDAYYPYCAPEVRAMRATGIETVGFNAFNGKYAEVIGGQAYYLGVTIDTAHFSTDIGGELEEITIPENRLYIPPANGYIYATGSDICINLSHSGVRNGEYKPYAQNTLLLPEIAKYFPEGMHSIGDVYDEITIDRAVRRCAARAYVAGDENDAEVITDKVTTVYKLPLPEVMLIDEPLQLDYKVDDFGTERMLSNTPSAPFKADIVYQFNAEGRIRDNSRNIEKLEKLVKQPSDWLEENPSSPAFIKNKPTMPTAIAPVTEVIVEYSLPSTLLPNVIHEVAIGLEAFTMPPLYQGDSRERNVYKMVFVAPEASKITFNYSVLWRDGVAPNWADVGNVVELTFTTMAEVTTILGEWKIYK